MKDTQISISYKDEPSLDHFFFFRTDWMDPDDAMIVLQELKSSFPSPKWQITINERTTTHTMQVL